MQNTLFRYTKGLGMVEAQRDTIDNFGHWSETKDQAMITHYLVEWAILLDDIHKAQKELEKNERALAKLHKEFGHLREKYPEEFI